MNPELKKYQTELEDLQSRGNLRQLRTFSPENFGINLSSNDYLGLAAEKELYHNFFQEVELQPEHFLCGSGSSRLLTGNYPLYEELEQELDCLYQKPVLFFNSGYHANIGILPALTGKKDLILSDKLNHASIIDGIRLADADFIRFRHLDYDHLEQILSRKREQYERVFIVTESVFSMDGDEACLKSLVGLKKKYNCFLYVDEAHALGVRGFKGLGVAEENGLTGEIDLLVGTFGKAMASQGAFVACHQIIKDYLINRMRSLIFTTSLPPVIVNWNLQILRTVVEMHDKREYLKDLSDKLRNALRDAGIETGGTSNIIPIHVGDNQKCIILAEHMQRNGFLVFPIRPPTVPPNTARLRLSVCANMKWEELKEIPKMVKEILV